MTFRRSTKLWRACLQPPALLFPLRPDARAGFLRRFSAGPCQSLRYIEMKGRESISRRLTLSSRYPTKIHRRAFEEHPATRSTGTCVTKLTARFVAVSAVSHIFKACTQLAVERFGERRNRRCRGHCKNPRARDGRVDNIRGGSFPSQGHTSRGNGCSLTAGRIVIAGSCVDDVSVRIDDNANAREWTCRRTGE
jgi:hypothetical protein